MATSFSIQIPVILHLVQKLKPRTILDIGKGFGKYGFLLHEYVGIDNTRSINPSKTMAQQSDIQIDAVEVDKDLNLPHLTHLYRHIYMDDIISLYPDLYEYDLILMIDVIEHIEKKKAIDMLKFFLNRRAVILISTPIQFFEQYLYESEYEKHVSHWTVKDFRQIGNVDFEYLGEGAIYLLSTEPINIIGFGNSPVKKIRRFGRLIRDEMKSLLAAI